MTCDGSRCARWSNGTRAGRGPCAYVAPGRRGRKEGARPASLVVVLLSGSGRLSRRTHVARIDRKILVVGACIALGVGVYLAMRGPAEAAAPPPAAPATPRHVLVVCDASDSGLDAACRHNAIALAGDEWIRGAIDRAGSTFLVMKVGESSDSTSEVTAIEVPRRWGQGLRASKARFVREAREQILAADLAGGGSAVVEAMLAGSRRLDEQTGDRTMIVMSDLRQVTPRVWNFERRAPVPRLFLRWMRRESTVPNLSGLRLIVCGVHMRRAGSARHHTPALDSRIHAVWHAALAEMGAPDTALSSTCDQAALRLSEPRPSGVVAMEAP